MAGDFDGDGKDELLAVSLSTKWSQLYSFENNEWIQDWSNNGNGKIKWWVFNQGDDFIVGDFDGDGKDELLIVSFTTKWSQLYSFENNEWIQD
ncbi:MAG: VCBS repeat-containing protein [Lewinellaceae bacterium]|nr:VCBS repeat-containing protein [Lewinellaceae bacterium]